MALDDPHRRPAPRPRTKSMLSFGSHRSAESAAPKQKLDLTETPKEKAHRRMTSKADPTKAISELQPGQEALAQSTLDSLRDMTHKDMYGNVITDPDASNPTRPRMERPLDTIRSFEAAIDGNYKRMSIGPGASESQFASRRSSYYPGHGAATPQPRFSGEGGYGGYGGHPAVNGHHGYAAHRMSRPDSYMDGYGAGPPVREHRRPPPRNASDPTIYGNNASGAYTNHNAYYGQNYESTPSASVSGNSRGTNPWGTSPDPSSENSSVERMPAPPPPPKHEIGEQYGFVGFGAGPDLQQSPIMEESAQYGAEQGMPGRAPHPSQPPEYAQAGYQHGQVGSPTAYGGAGRDMGPPPPPPHGGQTGMRLPRPPSKLQSSRRASQYDGYGAPVAAGGGSSDAGEKRKSWLKRRFSKNS